MNMNEYMAQFEKYSSVEAYEVAAMAKEKGLTLLEGNFNTYSAIPERPNYERYPGRKGYAIVKVILGLYLTLDEDGSVFQDNVERNGRCIDTVWFRYSLEQAKEQILNFDGVIKNPPNFYAYVRVYFGEPAYYAYLQRFFLDEFARKHGIVFKEKIMCIGGQNKSWIFSWDEAEFDDIADCCKESFSKITENDFLLVTDASRLNNNFHAWSYLCHVIPVAYLDTSYKKYAYLGKIQQEQEDEKMLDDEDAEKMNQEDDVVMDGDEPSAFDWQEYQQMAEEHRKMMMEQDEPFIEGVEEYE